MFFRGPTASLTHRVDFLGNDRGAAENRHRTPDVSRASSGRLTGSRLASPTITP